MGLELKKGDHIDFLVDRSGSMAESDCDGDTRYHFCRESIQSFVKAAVNFGLAAPAVRFFNNKVDSYANVSTAEEVANLIDAHKTGNSTRTDLAITAAWNDHLARKKAGDTNGTHVIIFTDGEPDDKSVVEKTIVGITNTMSNPEEFRLLFLTVGVPSTELAQWLEDLDDSLKGAKYDIVGVEKAGETDFAQAVADLIGSTTTQGEAAAGQTQGKATSHI